VVLLNALLEILQHLYLPGNVFAAKIHLPDDVGSIFKESRAATAEGLGVEVAKVDEIVHKAVNDNTTELGRASLSKH
jgi:hypothetical protein